MPEDHRRDEVAHTAITRAGTGHALPSTLATGYRYAEMGYTACFEPAMLPANARQAHMEMGDTPILDNGAYVMLGNDDFLLRLMLARRSRSTLIRDYIAWTMHATQAMAVKVVNPGGISAFKFNQRKLDLDEQHVHYGITPRDDHPDAGARAAASSACRIRCTSTAATSACPATSRRRWRRSARIEGLPLHLTHIQFHSYGTGATASSPRARRSIAEP